MADRLEIEFSTHTNTLACYRILGHFVIPQVDPGDPRPTIRGIRLRGYLPFSVWIAISHRIVAYGAFHIHSSA